MTGIYFSGTGNTEYCINLFLNACKGKGNAYSIEDKNVCKAVEQDNDIVFAYPVYYSNMPKIVRDFIDNNSRLWKGKSIFIIASMGLFSGDGTGVSARIFKKYGADIRGGLHIKMPDCIGDVKALKKTFEENKKTVAAAESKIISAAQMYEKGDPPRDGLSALACAAGFFGQRLYFSGITKEYKAYPKIDSKKCTGCGLCAGKCPMKNIRTENEKAVSGNMCTLCYRCFSLCPQKAVTILGSRVLCQHRMDTYK